MYREPEVYKDGTRIKKRDANENFNDLQWPSRNRKFQEHSEAIESNFSFSEPPFRITLSWTEKPNNESEWNRTFVCGLFREWLKLNLDETERSCSRERVIRVLGRFRCHHNHELYKISHIVLFFPRNMWKAYRVFPSLNNSSGFHSDNYAGIPPNG